jgi:hypothetical protein
MDAREEGRAGASLPVSTIWFCKTQINEPFAGRSVMSGDKINMGVIHMRYYTSPSHRRPQQ